jgi:hypothetical protein
MDSSGGAIHLGKNGETPFLCSKGCSIDRVGCGLERQPVHWYAVRTLPRHEKSIRKYLESRHPSCFLPVYRIVSRQPSPDSEMKSSRRSRRKADRKANNMNHLRRVALPLLLLLPFLRAEAQKNEAVLSSSAPLLMNVKSASAAQVGYKLPLAAFGSFVERPVNNLGEHVNEPLVPTTPEWRDSQVSRNSEIETATPHLGKSFWFPWVAAVGLSIASTELTVHCETTYGCSQPNAMWGSSPSRLELYGIKGSIDAVGFYFSRRLKREGHSGWKYIAYGFLAGHAAETGWSAEALATHSSQPANTGADL